MNPTDPVLASRFADDVREELEMVEQIENPPSFERHPCLAMYMFFSFDLVGSTEMKSEAFDFAWIDLVRAFFSFCPSTLEGLGVKGARVWKYLGDEILFYKPIRERHEIEHTVSMIFRTQRAYALGQKETKFAEAATVISVKAAAWLCPVVRYVDAAAHRDDCSCLSMIGTLIGDDQVSSGVSSKEEAETPIDFLGPNIDAGFRIGAYARKLQLVVSPSLAYYLLKKNARINDLRVVDFAVLKGVARGALYPIVWYHENWADIRIDFTYEDVLKDALVKKACDGAVQPASLLDEVRERFTRLGYFFDPAQIEEIISIDECKPLVS